MGYLTPPFGMNLFYMKGIVSADITMQDIYWSIVPYVGVMIIVLILASNFPGDRRLAPEYADPIARIEVLR